MLAAHDLGIGSCWIHRAKEEFEMQLGQGTACIPWALRMNMRESDTVRSAMWTGIIRMLFQENEKPRILYQIGWNCHERRVSRLL